MAHVVTSTLLLGNDIEIIVEQSELLILECSALYSAGGGTRNNRRARLSQVGVSLCPHGPSLNHSSSSLAWTIPKSAHWRKEARRHTCTMEFSPVKTE